MSATISKTKICCGCAKELLCEQFYKTKYSRDGLNPRCKECVNSVNRDWRNNNLDKSRAYTRSYMRSYRIKYPERMKELSTKYIVSNRDKIESRRRYLKSQSRKNISDDYVIKLIRRRSNVKREDISVSLVECRRKHLLIHRTKDFFGIMGTINRLQNITMENIDKDISNLITLITQGADCLEKAGKLLLEMENKNPEACKLILKKCPNMNMSRLETLKRVGRGELNPYLILDGSPAAQKLLELPRVSQDKYMTEPIPVAVLSGGNVKVEYKRLHEISRNEVDIIFNARRPRTPEEQVEMIRNKLATRQTRQSLRYAIDGEKVTFYAHSTFTREQLEEILGKIQKPSANQLESVIKKNQIEK